MALPVYVLNRDQDTGRLAAFTASAREYHIDFKRISAFDGHAADAPFRDHADLIGAHFWGAPEVKPGALGCFLSHRSAWWKVLDNGHPNALICEDDAVFFEDLSRLEHSARALGSVDIIFANTRLASWCAAVGGDEAHPLSEVMARLAASGGPKGLGLKSAPGGDCYVLSASGARRLLELTEAQRIVCGVDWAMVWNSLSDVDDRCARAFPELGILLQHLSTSTKPLNSLVFSRAVAGQSGGVASTIRHRITRPVRDLLRD